MSTRTEWTTVDVCRVAFETSANPRDAEHPLALVIDPGQGQAVAIQGTAEELVDLIAKLGAALVVAA